MDGRALLRLIKCRLWLKESMTFMSVTVLRKLDKNYFRNSSDVVDKLDDIYDIGTFCQVTEMRNVDDKLRLVLLGHRRIKITDISKPAESKKTGDKTEAAEKPATVENIVQVNPK